MDRKQKDKFGFFGPQKIKQIHITPLKLNSIFPIQNGQNIYPYGSIGLVTTYYRRISKTDGIQYRYPGEGTGFLVARNIVMSNAHSIFDSAISSTQQPSQIYFTPQSQQRSLHIKVIKCLYNKRYRQNIDKKKNISSAYDVALLLLQQNQNLKKLNILPLEINYERQLQNDQQVIMIGYSGNYIQNKTQQDKLKAKQQLKTQYKLIGSNIKIPQKHNLEFISQDPEKQIIQRQIQIFSNLMSISGTSGSPIFVKQQDEDHNQKYILVGIHCGTKIARIRILDLNKYIQIETVKQRNQIHSYIQKLNYAIIMSQSHFKYKSKATKKQQIIQITQQMKIDFLIHRKCKFIYFDNKEKTYTFQLYQKGISFYNTMKSIQDKNNVQNQQFFQFLFNNLQQANSSNTVDIGQKISKEIEQNNIMKEQQKSVEINKFSCEYFKKDSDLNILIINNQWSPGCNRQHSSLKNSRKQSVNFAISLKQQLQIKQLKNIPYQKKNSFQYYLNRMLQELLKQNINKSILIGLQTWKHIFMTINRVNANLQDQIYIFDRINQQFQFNIELLKKIYSFLSHQNQLQNYSIQQRSNRKQTSNQEASQKELQNIDQQKLFSWVEIIHLNYQKLYYDINMWINILLKKRSQILNQPEANQKKNNEQKKKNDYEKKNIYVNCKTLGQCFEKNLNIMIELQNISKAQASAIKDWYLNKIKKMLQIKYQAIKYPSLGYSLIYQKKNNLWQTIKNLILPLNKQQQQRLRKQKQQLFQRLKKQNKQHQYLIALNKRKLGNFYYKKNQLEKGVELVYESYKYFKQQSEKFKQINKGIDLTKIKMRSSIQYYVFTFQQIQTLSLVCKILLTHAKQRQSDKETIYSIRKNLEQHFTVLDLLIKNNKWQKTQINYQIQLLKLQYQYFLKKYAIKNNMNLHYHQFQYNILYQIPYSKIQYKAEILYYMRKFKLLQEDQTLADELLQHLQIILNNFYARKNQNDNIWVYLLLNISHFFQEKYNKKLILRQQYEKIIQNYHKMENSLKLIQSQSSLSQNHIILQNINNLKTQSTKFLTKLKQQIYKDLQKAFKYIVKAQSILIYKNCLKNQNYFTRLKEVYNQLWRIFIKKTYQMFKLILQLYIKRVEISKYSIIFKRNQQKKKKIKQSRKMQRQRSDKKNHSDSTRKKPTRILLSTQKYIVDKDDQLNQQLHLNRKFRSDQKMHSNSKPSQNEQQKSSSKSIKSQHFPQKDFRQQQKRCNKPKQNFFEQIQSNKSSLISLYDQQEFMIQKQITQQIKQLFVQYFKHIQLQNNCLYQKLAKIGQIYSKNNQSYLATFFYYFSLSQFYKIDQVNIDSHETKYLQNMISKINMVKSRQYTRQDSQQKYEQLIVSRNDGQNKHGSNLQKFRHIYFPFDEKKQQIKSLEQIIILVLFFKRKIRNIIQLCGIYTKTQQLKKLESYQTNQLNQSSQMKKQTSSIRKHKLNKTDKSSSIKTSTIRHNRSQTKGIVKKLFSPQQSIQKKTQQDKKLLQQIQLSFSNSSPDQEFYLFNTKNKQITIKKVKQKYKVQNVYQKSIQFVKQLKYQDNQILDSIYLSLQEQIELIQNNETIRSDDALDVYPYDNNKEYSEFQWQNKTAQKQKQNKRNSNDSLKVNSRMIKSKEKPYSIKSSHRYMDFDQKKEDNFTTTQKKK